MQQYKPYKSFLERLNTWMNTTHGIFTAIANDPAYDKCILTYYTARNVRNNTNNEDMIGDTNCKTVVDSFKLLYDLMSEITAVYEKEFYTDPDYFELIEKIHAYYETVKTAGRTAFKFHHYGQLFMTQFIHDYRMYGLKTSILFGDDKRIQDYYTFYRNRLTLKQFIDLALYDYITLRSSKTASYNSLMYRFGASKKRMQHRNTLLKSDIMEIYARKTMNPRNLQPLLEDPDKDVDDFMCAYVEGL